MKSFKVLRFIIIIIPIIFAPQILLSREEYSFDLSEIEEAVEKKPYSLSGYMEFRLNFLYLDEDAAFYTLKFFDSATTNRLDEYKFGLLLDADYQKQNIGLFLRTNIDAVKSDLESDMSAKIFEGYLSLTPSFFFAAGLGKKTLNWGTGYAWNPVGFVQRPKDPGDPGLPREGIVVAAADIIKSYGGQLQTVSLTPVFIPVYEGVNEDFGEINHINFAGRAYFLFYDTDIDFMFLTQGSKPFRFGADFSRNITSNFEIHGEFAFINNFEKKIIDSDGNLFEKKYDARSYLLGVRYLTSFNTTIISEYYRNGTGFTTEEMEDFFDLIDKQKNLSLTPATDSLLKEASSLADKSYGTRNPMKDYLYLRISQREPFDILYFTPSITGIYNLNDRSYSLSPEFLYSGVTNLELRLKGSFLKGGPGTEYGEKLNDYRVEIRARYYFDAVKLMNL